MDKDDESGKGLKRSGWGREKIGILFISICMEMHVGLLAVFKRANGI